MENKIKIPDLKKFIEDYYNLKNNFEDLKIIISSIPIDNLSLTNINKLNDSLFKLKKSCNKYINSLKDNEYMYDFFEEGKESQNFCKKLNIDSHILYEIRDTFIEIINFDIKEFILKNKK